MNLAAQFTEAESARAAIFAGKATFTLVSKKTGTRYTYKVNAKKNKLTGKVEWPVSDADRYVLEVRTSVDPECWGFEENPEPVETDRFLWTFEQVSSAAQRISGGYGCERRQCRYSRVRR